MMNICVLSNSHAAALQLGLAELPDELKAGFNIRFFASRQNRLSRLRRGEGKLICNDPEVARDLKFTSGGLEYIDPAEYDVFILHALGFRAHYTPFIDCCFSRQFVNEYVRARWHNTVSQQLATLLRGVTSKPMIFSPQPYWSGGDKELRLKLGKTAEPIKDQLAVVGSHIAAKYENVRVLVQPQESVVDGIFTARRFSRNSSRLDVGDRQSGRAHDNTDHQHMNADYGALVWRDIFQPLL